VGPAWYGHTPGPTAESAAGGDGAWRTRCSTRPHPAADRSRVATGTVRERRGWGRELEKLTRPPAPPRATAQAAAVVVIDAQTASRRSRSTLVLRDLA
jgi:hypothetical protein